MKKNFMWTMAALFVGGLALTGCSMEDNPNPTPILPENPEELWDKTSSVFDFEDGNAVFTATSRMSATVEDKDGSKVLALKNAGNCQNGYGFTYFDMTSLVAQATKVTVKFDYFNGNGRGCVTIGDALVRGKDGKGAGMDRINRAPFYGSKGAIFRVGANTDGRSYVVNDQVLGAPADWCNKWLTIEVAVYNFDRQVEWTIKDENGELLAQSGVTEGEGEEAVFTPGKIDFWQADANEATQIDVFGFINNNTSYIDNVSIIAANDPSIKFFDYKIRYVDAEGNDLKEARVSNGREGTAPVLLAADSASFYLNEAGELVGSAAAATTKKIYVSNNAADVKIAEGAEVLLTFRDAETMYAVLTCNTESGQLLERFNDVNKYFFFEGDNFVMYPPTGYFKDGKAYFAEKTDYNGVQYTFPGTISPTKAGGKTYYIGTLSYAEDANVVYYANFETLALPKEDAGEGTGLGQLEGTVRNWWNWTNGYWTRFDGGRGIMLGANSYVWTEPIAAGTYTVTIYGRNDMYRNAEGIACPNPYYLALRDAAGTITPLEVAIPDWAASATGTSVVEGVTIPEGSSLVIGYDGAMITWSDGVETLKDISLDNIIVSKPAAE